MKKTAGLMYYLMGCSELHLPTILVKDGGRKTRQIQGTLGESKPIDQFRSKENLTFNKSEKDTEKMIMATIMALLLGLHDDHGMNSVVSQTVKGVFPVRELDPKFRTSMLDHEIEKNGAEKWDNQNESLQQILKREWH